MESDKTQKQFNIRPIFKDENFLTTDNELEDKVGELNFINFSRARKRRESAAIFNRLNEDTCINLLNDPELSREFEEEGAFEFHLSKGTITPEEEVIDYMDLDTPTPRMKKAIEITCPEGSAMSLKFAQNDGVNAPQKYSGVSSENTRKAAKNTPSSLNTDGEYQRNERAKDNALINYGTSETKQSNATTDNANNESLLIEQRARTTLKQFKEMMSKFKTLDVDAQPSPAKSASKSELKENLSHIKCPDDVVRLVNHLLYSPIGIHRTHPVQEMKIRESSSGVNNDDSPLEKHSKEFRQSRLFPKYKKQEFLQKGEATKDTVNQADFQEPMSLRDISEESTINKGKFLKYRYQKPENNSRSTPLVDLSNNEVQRNLELPNNESSTENLDEINGMRKRKRTIVTKPLSPHLSSINNSNKIQAKSKISPIAKKTKIRPSNLRAPTSIPHLKYNANQRRVGYTGVSLNSSNTDEFKTSTNSQMQHSRQASKIKQRK